MGVPLPDEPATASASGELPSGQMRAGSLSGAGVSVSPPRVASTSGVRSDVDTRARWRPPPGWRAAPALYRGALAALGLLGLALAIPQSFTDYYHAIGSYDEGVLLTNAHLLLRGELPYRDFYSNYPPGIFALLAALFAIFGPSIAVERALGLALHGVVALLAGRVAGRALGRPFSFVVAGLVTIWLLPLGVPAYAWLAGLSLALLACELWAWARAHGHPLRYALVGITLGALSAFRHDLFVYLSAALGGLASAWLGLRLWRGQRTGFFAPGSPLHGALPVCASATVVVALLWVPVLAVAGIERVLHDLYLDQVRHTMPARVLPLPALTQLGPSGWSPLPLPAFSRQPFAAAVLFTFAGPLLALGALLWPRGAGMTDDRSVEWLAALSVAVLPQMLGRTDTPHAIFSVTPALIASVIWLIGGPERRWQGVRAWGLAALGVVLLYLPLHDTLHSTQVRDPQPFRAAYARAGQTPVDRDYARALAFIRQHTTENDPIYVGLTDHRWTRKNNMDLYFLADRLGATRYMQFDPNLTNSEVVQRSMIEELERTQPKVAILVDAKRSSEPNESRNQGSALLDQYLRGRYKAKGRAGRLHFMLRRAPSAALPEPNAGERAAPPGANAPGAAPSP